MKKVLIGLLMITLYAVAQPGQSKYQGRSGYQQSIIWNDLHKSLQDSIRNIVGDSASANITDSLNALTASNGVVYSGRDFSQKIVKDTTTAKAYKPDSAGTMIYMKQLSSANSAGGGLLVYKSSGSALNGVRFAVTGGGIWERAELSGSPNVIPEWFGAIPDDGNDDYSAVRSAYDVALTLEGDVFFQDGIYRMSAPLVITPSGSVYATSVRRPRLIGSGRNRTQLLFYNNTDGIWLNGGISLGAWLGEWGIVDLDIKGNDAAGTSGVIIDSTSTGDLRFNMIRNFEIGVEIIQANNLLAENNMIADNVYGVNASVSPNEMTFINNYIINNDNRGFSQNSGNGTFITGGQIAHTDTGVYLTNGAPVFMKNVNMEGCGYNGIIVGTSARVTLDAVSIPYTTVVNPKGNLALSLTNGFADIHLLNHSGVGSDTSIYMEGTNAFVTCGPQQQNLLTIWKPTSIEYVYSLSSMRPLSSSSIAGLGTQARWGNFFKLHQRPSVMSEVPFYVARMITGDYFPAPLLNGTDQRVSLNAPNTTPGLDTYPLRMIHGYSVFTFPIDADSIKNFTVIVDTAGWNTLIDAGCFIDYNQPADTTKTFGYRSWIADNNAAAGTGTLLFCVDWTGNAALPPNGISYTFRWWAVIRPSRWVQ